MLTAILSFFSTSLKWIIDPKNRSAMIFIVLVIFSVLFLRQCSKINSLKDEIVAREVEFRRTENNHKAELDTIKQSYDKKTGVLTATISGYELTLKELDGKYSTLFTDMDILKDQWKHAKPSTIIQNNFNTTEKITGVDAHSSIIDSLGSGNITFLSDTIFSPGNTRKISGNIPYKFLLYNKKDSTLIKYSNQAFTAKILPSKSTLDFSQQMEVYTGINRDKKTGALSVWAKTKYPGVTFNVLNGANIQDDTATKKALVSARKPWGVGFSFGPGMLYNYSNSTLTPGFYIGVGINYTPKKLQFGN